MQIYDQKDIDILARTIDQIAPENRRFAARLVVEAARQCHITTVDLVEAVDWYLARRSHAKNA